MRLDRKGLHDCRDIAAEWQVGVAAPSDRVQGGSEMLGKMEILKENSIFYNPKSLNY